MYWIKIKKTLKFSYNKKVGLKQYTRSGTLFLMDSIHRIIFILNFKVLNNQLKMYVGLSRCHSLRCSVMRETHLGSCRYALTLHKSCPYAEGLTDCGACPIFHSRNQRRSEVLILRALDGLGHFYTLYQSPFIGELCIKTKVKFSILKLNNLDFIFTY